MTSNPKAASAEIYWAPDRLVGTLGWMFDGLEHTDRNHVPVLREISQCKNGHAGNTYPIAKTGPFLAAIFRGFLLDNAIKILNMRHALDQRFIARILGKVWPSRKLEEVLPVAVRVG